MSFGEALRHFREQRQLSTGDVAVRLSIFPGTYKRLESGAIAPPHLKANVIKIAKALELTGPETITLVNEAKGFHIKRVIDRFDMSDLIERST